MIIHIYIRHYHWSQSTFKPIYFHFLWLKIIIFKPTYNFFSSCVLFTTLIVSISF